MDRKNNLLGKISGWLAAKWQESALDQKRHLLNLVLLGMASTGVVLAIIITVSWLSGTTELVMLLGSYGLLVFYSISYWLGRKGKVTLASYFPVLAMFLISLLVNFQSGIGHVSYISFAIATLVAAILIGPWTGIGVAGLSLIAQLGAGYLQSRGGIPTATSPLEGYVIDAIAMTIGLVVIAIFITIYNREIVDTLKREQAARTDLESLAQTKEIEIEERTSHLERRLLQIRTAAEISRTIGGVLDPDALIGQVANLIRERFDLYYVGVFLLDRQEKYALLRAGTGEAGQKMLAERHKLLVGGDSMIGWCTANSEPRIALDVGQEAVRFNNPFLPETRSELALPITVGAKVRGALTVQSTQPSAFDENDIIVLQGIADSLATALENARLFSETQSNLEEIRALHRQYLARSWIDIPKHTGQLSYTYSAPTQQTTLEDDEPGKPLQVPLILRDQHIGSLYLETDKETWSPEDKALIDSVAIQAALALENARLLEETQRRAEREKITTTISSQVWTSSDIETILRTTLQELGQALHASEGHIQLKLSESDLDADSEVTA